MMTLKLSLKKKYTTDYVKIMRRKGKKIINKKTEPNYALQKD